MSAELQKKKANLGLLPAYEFLAIQEKYNGLMYRDIAVKIREKYGHHSTEDIIKQWFWKGGKLRQAYRDYADIMISIELEAADDFIRGNVQNAAKIMRSLMVSKDGSMVNFASAKEFLERGLGKVTEKRELSGMVGVVNMVDLFKEIKEQNGSGDTK